MIFLPYKDLKRSAASLDEWRLCHQRRVAKQIILFLTRQLGPESAHMKNHPDVQMWKGHVPALKAYHDILIDEWVSRGKNNQMKKFSKKSTSPKMPWWFGNEKLHRSHRAVLFNKWPNYYKHNFPAKDQNYNKGQYWMPENSTQSFVKSNVVPSK